MSLHEQTTSVCLAQPRDLAYTRSLTCVMAALPGRSVASSPEQVAWAGKSRCRPRILSAREAGERNIMYPTAKTVCLLILLSIVAVGCQAEPQPTGSAQLAVFLKQAANADNVARLTLTWSGSGATTATVELSRSNDTWGGVLRNIPAGSGCTFLGQAFDPGGTKLYEGQVSDVIISANQTTLVVINLQDVNPPPPLTHEAPLIESVVTSPTFVQTGGTLSLAAAARDLDAKDTLSYAWTATAGSFADASSATTTWTAPATATLASLTLTVTDSHGLAVSVMLDINVPQSISEGGTAIDVRFNSHPVVSRVSSSADQVAVGQSTIASVSATDRDGDTLSYQWTATCSGDWANPTSSTATFTPAALPSGACSNCQLNVTVSDGRGAQVTGSLTLCVSPPQRERLPPVITRAYQSSLTARPGQQISFEVVARDPQNSVMRFGWSATFGTLGAAQGSATHSRVAWTAPGCAVTGVNATITTTVTNDYGMSIARSFSITGLPACASGWAPTGSMASARRNHAATLLPSGKVLVTGGYNRNNYLASTELYDPTTGSWSFVGLMASARYSHTATLLPSGKVLVAGGRNMRNYEHETLVSAELYDPDTESWSATGSLLSARTQHTATLLPSGKVLVTGGTNEGDILSSAELYDPVTGSWSSTGSLSFARYSHTATLLPSGKVLVLGGHNSRNYLSSAELYDPTTGTWNSVRAMASERGSHTATLLPSGKVLVSAGFNYGNLASAELYDPATGTWSSAGSLAATRHGHNATLLRSGKVLVSGGSNTSSSLVSAQLYDPATGAWSAAGSMVSGRYAYTAVVLPSGKVLVAGGGSHNDSDYSHLASAELYTP